MPLNTKRQESPYQWWTPGPQDAGYSDWLNQAQPTPTTAATADDDDWMTINEAQSTAAPVFMNGDQTTTFISTYVPVASTSQLPTPTETTSSDLQEITSSSIETPSSSTILATTTLASVITSSAIASSSSSSSASVFSTGFLNKVVSPPSSTTSAPQASSSTSTFSSSPFIAFFQRIGKSPVYITLTCLVGIVILALIVAIISFCIRRRANRMRRERKFSASWNEEADDGDDEKDGEWATELPPVLVGDDGVMSPAMAQRFSGMSWKERGSLGGDLVVPPPAQLGSQADQRTWWSTMQATPAQEDRFTALPGLRPISGYSAQDSFMHPPALHSWTSNSSHREEIAPEESRFSSFSTTQSPQRRRSSLQVPIPSKLNRAMSRASTASRWSASTGATHTTDDYQTSAAEFDPSEASVHRRGSVSSLSSFQSGRVSHFRRKLSMGTITTASAKKLQTHRASWELLEEEEEKANSKAEMLIRARMRRTTSDNSVGTTLVGDAMTVGKGKGY